MLRGVLTISGIPRSANNLRENGDIRRIDNQSIIKVESLFIFEEGYINGILDPDILILTTSFVFILSNSFILKIFREIIRVNFLYYIFFCFRKWTTRSFVFSSSISTRRYWVEIVKSYWDKTSRILQFKRFFRMYSIQCEESKGDISYIWNPNRMQWL